MNQNFMNFVLGKQKSPHALMHNQQQAAVMARAMSASIVDSEAGILLIEQEARDARKRPLQLSQAEADSHLKHAGIAKKRQRLNATPNEEKRRLKLTMEFLSLTLRDPASSLTGRQLEQCVDAEDRLLVVTHCLGMKKTNTMATRMSPIRVYLAWADVEMAEQELDDDGNPVDDEWQWGGWPPTENQAYKHVKGLKAATAAKMLLESFGFLQGALGFQFRHVFISTRIAGYASIRVGEMGPLRKAAIASDETLARLEILVCMPDISPQRRIVAGAQLIRTVTRTRRSDWFHKYDVNVEKGFLVALVDRVKTSRALDREEKCIIGPIDVSITGLDWFNSIEELRAEQGIPLKTHPLVPAYGPDGWGNNDASTADENAIIKEIVQLVGQNPERHTSHTFKRTAITIGSKQGLDKDTLSVLAYHKVGSKSTNSYDQSRLEAVMGVWRKALVDYFLKINWTQLGSQYADLDIFNNLSLEAGNVAMGQDDFSQADDTSAASSDEGDSQADAGEVQGCEAEVAADENSDDSYGVEVLQKMKKADSELKMSQQSRAASSSDEKKASRQIDPADFESFDELFTAIHFDTELGGTPSSSSTARIDKFGQTLQDAEFCRMQGLQVAPSQKDVVSEEDEQSDQLTQEKRLGIDGVETPLEVGPVAVEHVPKPPESDDDEVDDSDDGTDSDDEAIRSGLVMHLISGRVHVCGRKQDQKTRCGLKTDHMELKFQLNEYDMKCARCFGIVRTQLPGRQAF